jgi:transposase-like protein
MLAIIDAPSDALLEDSPENVFQLLFTEEAAKLRASARAARAQALELSDGMTEAQVAIYAALESAPYQKTSELHRATGCARDTCHKWRSRYLQEHGLAPMTHGPRPGSIRKYASTTSPQETT